MVLVLMIVGGLACGEDMKFEKLLDYENVTVTKVEADGISITHSGGVGKIPLTELPDEVLMKLGISKGPEVLANEESGLYVTQDNFQVTQDIGEISKSDRDAAPGQKLYALIKANPNPTVSVITAKVVYTEHATAYVKYFFDKSKRILVYMGRTHFRGDLSIDDTLEWRIWHEVSPDDFQNGLPYYNDKLKTTPSPYRNPKGSFPIKYPKHERVTKWP